MWIEQINFFYDAMQKHTHFVHWHTDTAQWVAFAQHTVSSGVNFHHEGISILFCSASESMLSLWRSLLSRFHGFCTQIPDTLVCDTTRDGKFIPWRGHKNDHLAPWHGSLCDISNRRFFLWRQRSSSGEAVRKRKRGSLQELEKLES